MLYNIPGNADCILTCNSVFIVSSIKNHRRHNFPNLVSYLTLASYSGYIPMFGYMTPLMAQTTGGSNEYMTPSSMTLSILVLRVLTSMPTTAILVYMDESR